MSDAPRRRFERSPEPPSAAPPEVRAGSRRYEPEQTARRFRDLVVFASQAAELVAAGHDSFVAPAAWQPRAAGTYLIIELATVAEKLHPRVKEHYSDVPWGKIRAMRNIAAHRYNDVNHEIVWDILETFVPALIRGLGLPASPQEEIRLPAPLRAP